jgi:hypothetical protein
MINCQVARLLLPAVLIVLGALPAAAQIAAAAGSEADSLSAATARSDSTQSPQAYSPWQSPISSTWAVLVTPVFPGWGQLYTENSWRAGLAFGVQMLYWSNLLMNDRKAVRTKQFTQTLEPGAVRDAYALQVEEYRERVRDFAWWSLGAMLIIALDAYVDANLFRFDKDPVPIPDRWDAEFPAAAATPPVAPAGSLVVFQWRFPF